jgi:hypothetical protein
MNRASRHERFLPKSPGIFLLFLSSLCLATQLSSQEQQNPDKAPPQPPSATTLPQAATPSNGVAILLLKEATPVRLKLLHSLNSKTVVKDDPLNFNLAQDLLVDDKVVVKAGSVAIGFVRQAKPARTLGRGAQLALEMQYLKVGQARVPLRGTEARVGDNKKGETVTMVVLFGISGLVKHGSEIEVREGTVFTAYVDQDTELPAQSEAEHQVQ